MFTLKLFRRHPEDGSLTTKLLTVDHVQVMEIGKSHQALELFAFDGPEPSAYKTYFVGAPEEGMDAFGKPTHLDHDDQSWWGWGLLENWEGNTTQHFRPHSYG